MTAAGYDEVKTKHGIELVKREKSLDDEISDEMRKHRWHVYLGVVFYALGFVLVFLFSFIAERAGVYSLWVLFFRLGMLSVLCMMMISGTMSRMALYRSLGAALEKAAKQWSDEVKK